MTILHISQTHDLAAIGQQNDTFACLLHDDCRCDAQHFHDTKCMGIAIVGRPVAMMRRGKYLVERELSRRYACPVRLFKDENKAQLWLTKQLQVVIH